MNTPTFKIIVNVDFPTRFEINAKSYVIFKNFFMQEESTGNCFPTTSNYWLFSEFKENNNSDVIPVGEVKSFDTLQRAFDYAASNNLEFL